MPNAPAPAVPAGSAHTDFACFYLYGFTNHPYQPSPDLGKFGALYTQVIGAHGGLGIAGSFHPYQLVGQAGVSVWYAAYAQLYAHPNRFELFAEITLEQAQFVVVPPASFAEFYAWPDTRLTADENPIFERFVPFVVPFLVRKAPRALRWDAEIAAANGSPARIGAYLETVSQALRFVQPAPAFVLGFGEFEEQHPEKLVEQFLNHRHLLL